MSKLQELKDKILKCDPYDVVVCEMDNFDPYIHLNLPKELDELYLKLSVEDQEEYCEWVEELLYLLRTGNGWGCQYGVYTNSSNDSCTIYTN